MADVEPPESLGDAGRELWQLFTEAYVIEPLDRPVVEAACALADDAARLRADLADTAVTVPGSQGQPVSAPSLAAYRATVLAQAKLLSALADDEPANRSSAGRRLASMRRDRWSA